MVRNIRDILGAIILVVAVLLVRLAGKVVGRPIDVLLDGEVLP